MHQVDSNTIFYVQVSSAIYNSSTYKSTCTHTMLQPDEFFTKSEIKKKKSNQIDLMMLQTDTYL